MEPWEVWEFWEQPRVRLFLFLFLLLFLFDRSFFLFLDFTRGFVIRRWWREHAHRKGRLGWRNGQREGRAGVRFARSWRVRGARPLEREVGNDCQRDQHRSHDVHGVRTERRCLGFPALGAAIVTCVTRAVVVEIVVVVVVVRRASLARALRGFRSRWLDRLGRETMLARSTGAFTLTLALVSRSAVGHDYPFRASAPPMISISSVVIAAWRARL